jgi:hypothetical protein
MRTPGWRGIRRSSPGNRQRPKVPSDEHSRRRSRASKVSFVFPRVSLRRPFRSPFFLPVEIVASLYRRTPTSATGILPKGVAGAGCCCLAVPTIHDTLFSASLSERYVLAVSETINLKIKATCRDTSTARKATPSQSINSLNDINVANELGM